MRNITDIKDQIKSIKSIAQTTKAVELTSIAKMRQANEKYNNNSRYFSVVRYVMKDILDSKVEVNHRYLRYRSKKRCAFVVIASDTGMAGEYNSRVLNFALEKVNNHLGEKVVYTIGTMAAEFFVSKGITPEEKFLTYAQKPSLGHARSITANLVAQYDDRVINEVYIIYTVHKENRMNEVRMLRLLPILEQDFKDIELDEHHVAQWDFEPSKMEVFNILVPQYILGMIYSCMIQSVKCEHEERMEAMHTATNNAQEILSELELNFHRARQEQITTELAEISFKNQDEELEELEEFIWKKVK